MTSLLDKIVTPAFVAFQAHCWFAYAAVYTAMSFSVASNGAIIATAALAAGIKEFYIDKHFEDDQSFLDNLQDFAGYAAGIALAVLVRQHL